MNSICALLSFGWLFINHESGAMVIGYAESIVLCLPFSQNNHEEHL